MLLEDTDEPVPNEGSLHEGQRVGRYMLLRDMKGTTCAVSAGAVSALRETDSGTLLIFSGGKLHENTAIHARGPSLARQTRLTRRGGGLRATMA